MVFYQFTKNYLSFLLLITKNNMRMLRVFNALSYQNSTNETYLQNVLICTKARNYRILYVMFIFLSLYFNHLKTILQIYEQ